MDVAVIVQILKTFENLLQDSGNRRLIQHPILAILQKKKINKVIGTRGQGVGVWCPRELTTERLAPMRT